jgi:RHS repeat-associated protein
LGQTTNYAYDALNRLTSLSDPLGNTTTTTYNALGRIITTTNAKGQATNFEYDALGRLTKVTDAKSGTVTYTYDANGNRLTQTDPNGKTTSYVYDALNRLTQKTEPLGTVYQYAYDAVGNRNGLTDAKGNSITYAYDGNNRLKTITYPGASTVGFTFDLNGNRTQMVDSLGTSTYTYDSLNRMTAYTNPHSKTVGYGYDANSNRTSLTYPDGKVVSYAYDVMNRLVSVTDWVSRTTTYIYDAAGKLTNTTNPNLTTAAYSYDTAGRLTGLANQKSDTTVLSSYSYSLDALGNQLSVAKTEPLTPTLTSKNIAFTYDNENRLTQAGSTSNVYDANGNLTTRGTDTFSYDYNDRLSQSNIGGETSQYSYDGPGNRLSKVKGGVTTRYVLDVNGRLSHVLSETNTAGTITAYYVYGLGLISKVLPDNTPYYYHYDSRGSTIALTDSTQTQTDAYAYDSFGSVINNTGSTPNPFKYVGGFGVMDEGNGLKYIRARYYSPEIGRFITKDPITGKDGDSQSLNRYVYALNNPVRLVDVSGFSANEGGVLRTVSLSSDEVHNILLKGGNNALRAYLIERFGPALLKEGGKIALEKILKGITLQSVGYIAAHSTISPEILGAWGGTIMAYTGPTLGIASDIYNNYQDVYKHPERDMVEVAARLSIDVTVTAISGVATLLSGGTAGFVMSTAYGTNREEIQNDILYNPITDAIGSGLYNVGHENWFGNMLCF